MRKPATCGAGWPPMRRRPQPLPRSRRSGTRPPATWGDAGAADDRPTGMSSSGCGSSIRFSPGFRLATVSRVDRSRQAPPRRPRAGGAPARGRAASRCSKARPGPRVPRDGTLLGALFESLVTLSCPGLRTASERPDGTPAHLERRAGDRPDRRERPVDCRDRGQARRRRERCGRPTPPAGSSEKSATNSPTRSSSRPAGRPTGAATASRSCPRRCLVREGDSQ